MTPSASDQHEDDQPLAGHTILVTASPERSRVLLSVLLDAGAEAYRVPMIDFQAVPLSIAELAAGQYDWLVITSITTLRALSAAAITAGYRRLSEAVPPRTQIATVGRSSRQAVTAEGLSVALTPQHDESARGLVAALREVNGDKNDSYENDGDEGGSANAAETSAQTRGYRPENNRPENNRPEHYWSGKRVWLPQSDLAANDLAQGLRQLGADVDAVIAYRTVDYPAAQPLLVGSASGTDKDRVLDLDRARELLDADQVCAVTVASASAAQRIAKRLAPLGAAQLIAVGEPSARGAEAAGLRVAGIAVNPSPHGVLETLLRLSPPLTKPLPNSLPRSRRR